MARQKNPNPAPKAQAKAAKPPAKAHILAGKRLRETRDTAGDSQVDVGDKIGATGAAVSAWESGKKPPGNTHQTLVEAYTRSVAERLGRPELVVRATDWLDDDDRARFCAIASAVPS